MPMNVKALWQEHKVEIIKGTLGLIVPTICGVVVALVSVPTVMSELDQNIKNANKKCADVTSAADKDDGQLSTKTSDALTAIESDKKNVWSKAESVTRDLDEAKKNTEQLAANVEKAQKDYSQIRTDLDQLNHDRLQRFIGDFNGASQGVDWVLRLSRAEGELAQNERDLAGLRERVSQLEGRMASLAQAKDLEELASIVASVADTGNEQQKVFKANARTVQLRVAPAR
jgi:chromosome segregation ATPase